MRWPKLNIIFLIAILLSSSLTFGQTANVDVLKSKIDERNNQIKQLEEEIKQYNLEVTNAGTQAKTLQSTIKTLDLTKKKISTDINLTEKKINKTSLTIDQLGNEIDSAKAQINNNKKAIILAFQDIQSLQDSSLIEIVLSNKDIGEIWNNIDSIQKVGQTVRQKSNELADLKVEMEKKQGSLKGEKNNLLGLKQDLSGKKEAVELTTKEKAEILAQTKNKEQAFKELVKTKQQQKEQFEKEIFDYESQLNILIDKGSYPAPRNNVLSWPLDDVYITQRFGKTVGAEKLYTSGSHNGVDFRASVGTRVKNVLAGTVVGSGNTDAYPGCYSFGKWVMVKHDNGLSTIYAHLSSIGTTIGQRVETGGLIGYSGNTGYSTGPHLHISVYATQGVRIEQFVNSRGCKQATIPLADVKAYLDPLDYLPKI
ncbi:MAG: peptidoglycan DD-metalloendopeptidase family protein [Parcubacteria group bacterium]